MKKIRELIGFIKKKLNKHEEEVQDNYYPISELCELYFDFDEGL